MPDLDPDDDLLEPESLSFDPNYVASLVRRHRESTSRRNQQLLEMWILETVLWKDHPDLDDEKIPTSIDEWISLEGAREALEKMQSPQSDSGYVNDPQESDEPEAFASLSKDEVDYLNDVISGTNDERAKSIIKRAYPDDE